MKLYNNIYLQMCIQAHGSITRDCSNQVYIYYVMYICAIDYHYLASGWMSTESAQMFIYIYIYIFCTIPAWMDIFLGHFFSIRTRISAVFMKLYMLDVWMFAHKISYILNTMNRVAAAILNAICMSMLCLIKISI